MRDAGPMLESTKTAQAPTAAGCTDDCEFDAGRRAFMRSGLMAVAALTAIAGGSVPLHAMARTYAQGRRQGDIVSYPVPVADGATIDDANAVILVRYQGAVSAFSMRCPHKQTPLEWQPDNARFYCPKHKSTFQPEGTLIQGKATRNMDRHPVRLEEGKVIVDTSTTIRSSDDAAAWTAAAIKVG
ncbi:MAG TPA: Rieske (2Fe-2S) protein [Gemmatimonadaceae bacterium]|nr:Rieske (2Fe-2S) protein [Gemmatimonadaceae bacterium]